MGLDLWFQTDVARILAATQETMSATMNAAPLLEPEQAEAYRQGFTAAIRAVAVAFGITGPPPPGGNGNRPARSLRTMESDLRSLPGR